MSKIQQTTKFEPLNVKISIKRKSDGSGSSSLTPYSFNITQPSGATVSSGTFTDSYFVPVYNPLSENYTTIALIASFSGAHQYNYPVQCQWDFGDGKKESIYNRTVNKNALSTGSYAPVYHRFLYGGPSGTAAQRKITFTVIDSANRKIVLSKIVYPKSSS
jgi:hypothetical protein